MYYTERFNAYSHLLGLILVTAFGSALIVYLGILADAYKIVANSIFVSSMIILYVGSFLYHSVRKPSLKKIFQKVDHLAIYILIAGTYAPFMLVAIQGGWGWSIFSIVWGLAIVGIIQEFIFKAKGTRPISLVIYLAMGWIGFLAAKPGWEALSLFSIVFLVLGGLFYTVGIYWYVNDEKIKHGHGIWHVFVLLGSLSHMASIYGITYYN
ncbi:MAG: hemolysin III family protein [Neisseriaceae bacterium]|nr:hemolysin III family protein [Neisseriaceae bacterium]